MRDGYRWQKSVVLLDPRGDLRHREELKGLTCIEDERQLSPDAKYMLFYEEGLLLRYLPETKFKPLKIDFLESNFLRRILSRNQSEDLLKALGKTEELSVLDATAGFGQDLFLMASRGHHVVALESHPLVFALLKDAVVRAAQDDRVREFATRIQLSHQDFFDSEVAGTFDLVYLDPMFPEKSKTSLPQKKMQILQDLTGASTHSPEQWVERAQCFQPDRIVFKRPSHAQEMMKSRGIIRGKVVSYYLF